MSVTFVPARLNDCRFGQPGQMREARVADRRPLEADKRQIVQLVDRRNIGIVSFDTGQNQ